MRPRVIKHALNRGTAVYLGGNNVRFIWPCGCKNVEHLTTPNKQAYGPEMTQRLVKYWRSSGVTLKQCRRHPDFYSKTSLVAKLNAEHPQVEIQTRLPVSCPH